METSGGWRERSASRIFGRRQWQDLKQRIPGRSTMCFGRYFRLFKTLLCIPECEFLLWRVNLNSNQCIAGCRPLSRCPLCMGTMYRLWMTLLLWFTSELQMRGSIGSRWFLPGSALVNSIPALRHLPSWFPGTWFNVVGEEMKVLTTEVQNAPMD